MAENPIIFIAEPTVMRERTLLLSLFFGTVVMILVMRIHGKPLTDVPSTKAGIVSLEFAKTKQKAHSIVTTWSSISSVDLRKLAVTNTYIDFVFLFFYSLFLYAGCYYFSLSQKGTHAAVLRTVGLLGLTAGLLDAVENYFLLKMLTYQITNEQALLTWWLAAVKFLFAGTAAVFILVHFLRSLFINSKNKTP